MHLNLKLHLVRIHSMTPLEIILKLACFLAAIRLESYLHNIMINNYETNEPTVKNFVPIAFVCDIIEENYRAHMIISAA
jgi:hypothetical protein